LTKRAALRDLSCRRNAAPWRPGTCCVARLATCAMRDGRRSSLLDDWGRFVGFGWVSCTP
jgi:hypothetical protein